MIIDKIKDYLSTQTDCAVNIEDLIKELGIALDKEASLDPEISGQIERESKGEYKISVNAKDHYYRRRFTMAHELGHYVYHRDLLGDGTDDNVAYRSTSAGEFFNPDIKPHHETQANRFAAQLLMPKRLVQYFMDECGGDRSAVAKKLQVSEQALDIRLQNLNL
jgi:Zn-dependent peptidase ImmA (M78 family)